jgi:hypothetical protein
MQSDLTVGPCSKLVPPLLKFPPLALEIVKFSVDDNPNAVVFVGDGLVAGGQINDAQARMTQGDTMVGGNPGSLAVFRAWVETGLLGENRAAIPHI